MRMRSPWADVPRVYGKNVRVAPDAEWPDDDLDLDEPEFTEKSDLAPPSRPLGAQPRSPAPRSWKERLAGVDVAMQAPVDAGGRAWPLRRELLYIFDPVESTQNGTLTLGIFYRDPRKGGEWTRPRPANIDRQQAQLLPDPADRRVLGLLEGGRDPNNPWSVPYTRYGAARRPSSAAIGGAGYPDPSHLRHGSMSAQGLRPRGVAHASLGRGTAVGVRARASGGRGRA